MGLRNLFLIDDDEDDQEIFIAATNEISNTINVSAFVDARDALKYLQVNRAFPDLIFLDLNMPLMNGQQFLKVIKQDNDLKKIPVIIFSTSANSKTIEKMKAEGASDFITKPGLFRELVEILKPILVA